MLGAITFGLLYTVNLTAPFEPMSLNLSPSLLAVGARDCPNNDLNNLFTYNLQTGKPKSNIKGISQVSLARGSASAVIGVGWNKENSYTELLSPGYHLKYDGEPSMMIPTAISNDGSVSVFCVEPNPDTAHLNNRTASLLVMNKKGGVLAAYNITGQMSYDPQTVSMSSYPSATNKYTIGAVLGSLNKVFDVSVASGVLTEKWSSSGLEADISISGTGDFFAVTSGGDTKVDVFCRDRKDSFGQVGVSIEPPTAGLGFRLQPMSLTFNRGQNQASDKDVLAVVWGDQVRATTFFSFY